MKPARACLALACLLLACTAAAAADAAFALRRDVAAPNVPLDRRYDQMDEAQRALLRARYVGMGVADEPPWPAKGMAPLMMALRQGADAYRVTGQLDMTVEVGPDGAARSISVYEGAGDPQFTKFAAALLMTTKYKPAVCAGQPCAMAWPLQVTLSRGR